MPRTRRRQRLLDNATRIAGVLVQVLHQRVRQHRRHLAGDLAVAQLGLGLALELGLLQLHRDHRGQAVADVVAGEVGVLLLEDRRLARVLVQGCGQGRPEPGEVGAALLGVDVVGVGEDVLGEHGVLVLHRDLDDVALDLALHVHRPRVDHVAVGVEVGHEGLDAALEVEGVLVAGLLVAQDDGDRLVEEGQLAQAVGDDLPGEAALGEDLRVGPEAHQGALLLGAPVLLDRRLGHAPLVALAPQRAFLVDLDVEPLGERVDDRQADAVQAARHLVAAAAELAAGVQLGQHHLQRRALLGGMHVDGDAAPVVEHRHRAVGVQGGDDQVAVAGQGLVDGVVDQLPDEVVQAPVVGRADVHAGTAAHRLQPLQHLDLLRPVVAAALAAAAGRLPGRRGRRLRTSRRLRNSRRNRVRRGFVCEVVGACVVVVQRRLRNAAPSSGVDCDQAAAVGDALAGRSVPSGTR